MAISFHDPNAGYRHPQDRFVPGMGQEMLPERQQTEGDGTFAAAFRQENPVYNLFEYMGRPLFEPDPGFDYEARASKSLLFQHNPDHFIGIASNEEWDAFEARLAREIKDRAAIESAGLGGIVASIAAGVLSPTILLPAGAGIRAATTARAAASGAVWGAVGVGLDEIVLQSAQSERTGLETAAGIGGALILGGALGGAARYLAPDAFARIAEGMADIEGQQAILAAAAPHTKMVRTNQNQEPAVSEGMIRLYHAGDLADADATLPNTFTTNKDYAQSIGGSTKLFYIDIPKEDDLVSSAAINDFRVTYTRTLTQEQLRLFGGAREAIGTREAQNLSAAANPEAEYFGADRDPGKILGTETALGRFFTFSWLGPLSNQSMNESPPLRTIASALSTGGIYRENNLNFVATARGGDVESRVKGWLAGAAVAVHSQKKLFRQYMTDKGESAFRRHFSFGGYDEFLREIGRAQELRLQGVEHPMPAVREALGIYNEKVFGPALREAIELGMPGFEELTYNTALKHASQVVRRDLANQDTVTLRRIVEQNAIEQLRRNPELMQDPKIAKAIGLDLSPVKLRDARATGDVMDVEELAERITEKIMESWTGQFSGHGTVQAITSMGSPKMHHFVFIDPTRDFGTGKQFGEFLERDMEKIGRAFVRGIAPDIELYRAFGTVDPRGREGKSLPFWSQAKKRHEELLEEAAQIADEKKRLAEIARLNEGLSRFERDFDGMVGRIRHDWGLPKDPSSVGHRLGRAVLNLNTVRLMGSVVLSSIPDLARPVLKYGLMTTFRDGVIPLLRSFKEFKMLAQEGVVSGSATDVYLHGRSNAIFDIMDENEYGNLAERTLQTMTNKIGQFPLGMFDYWNTGLKMFSAHIVVSKLSRDIAAAVNGKATKAQKAFLSSHGIDEALARRMYEKMRTGGGTEIAPGVYLPNTEDWGKINGEDIFDFKEMRYKDGFTSRQRDEAREGIELMRNFRAAVARAVDDTIITPGIERPLWVDGSTAGRIIGQFRSFTLSSTLKVVVAARQDAMIGNHAQVLTGTIFSLGLGMLSYYTWAISVGGPTKERMLNELDAAINGDEEALGRWADEAIARSGLLGVFAEAQKFAERTPGLQDYVTFAGSPTARSPFVNPVMEALGPSVSLANNLGRIAVTLDDPTSETFRKGKQLLPYQNVFLYRQLLDRLNEAAMTSAGVNPN